MNAPAQLARLTMSGISRCYPTSDVAGSLVPNLPQILEGLLLAEAEFARTLREQAPMPPGNPASGKYQELLARYDRYIPSDVVRAIAMLLYEFKAFGVTDAESIARVIELHNARIKAILDDPDYPKRSGISRERLRGAMFSDVALRNAKINMMLEGAGQSLAFDQSCIQRLLVEFVPRDKVIDAVELLVDLGCFETRKGSSNATIYVSAGILETVFAGFLAALGRNIGGIKNIAEDERDRTP